MLKKLSLLGISILVLALFVACGGNGESGNEVENEGVADNAQQDTTDEPSSEGADLTVNPDRILSVAMGTFPESLDPTAINEAGSSLINTHIYETLVTRTYDMEIVPALATSWERIDEYTVEFNLREGVYFHDGSPFTAADVEFSLQRSQAHPIASAVMGVLDPDGFEIIDDHTIRISTSVPFSPLVPFLGHNTAFIISREAALQHGDEFINNPVGTGPFVFESQVLGDRVTLMRNENYHGEAPQLAGIVFQVIPEPAQRLIGLETGELDFSFDIAQSDAARALEHEDIVLHSRVNNMVRYLSMNTTRAPFDDVRVRQAFNYAIDTELLIETILEGFGEPSQGPFASGMRLASTDVQLPEYNVQRALELLAEAGLEDGFEITMNVHTPVNQNLALAIEAMLAQINVTVEVVSLELAAHFELINDGEFDTFIMSFNPGTGDEDNMVTPMFHSESIGSTGNRGRFENSDVDALIEAARVAFDDEERAAIYRELQELLIYESPWVFLDAGVFLHASRENVHGYSVRLNGQQTLRDVYVLE